MLGKQEGLDGNRHVGDGVIAGAFFVARDGEEDIVSATEDDLKKYAEKFAEPEDISQDEVQADTAQTLMRW